MAQQRATAKNGTLVLRNEDLDAQRCRREFVAAMFEDLRWFGFWWQEGPDVGGPFAPYDQSQRREQHRAILERLIRQGNVYRCTCSRQDVLRALQAPHQGEEEPVYPGTCRPRPGQNNSDPNKASARFAWRFRVPDGEAICFEDGNYGPQSFIAGKDFGDFVVWRPDDVPAYQLAVVADDIAMEITEVVRGADLLLSAARQLLIYRALNCTPPAFFHCPVVTDETGARLAKRHDALSLRALRESGAKPETLRASFAGEQPTA